MTPVTARWRSDALACLILVALWAAFFWRFLTPVPGDQASLVEGDFSGQFVAFGAYQAARLWRGEVPLWNPYNNGGLPFLADTQSAVFYPPRLLTVALSGLAGAWTYHALELEMAGHVLLGSLLMYALVRRLTVGQGGSVLGGMVAALTWAYGGFLTGYPPLQLALLEAAIWGPLLLLGIHEATARQAVRWPWLMLSGLALGLSVMAGHPQTAWFLGCLYLALLAYRVYRRRWRWPVFVGSAALVGALGAALAAVQLLPALEYLQHTTRVDFSFEAKANGFPLYDVIQVLFPRVLSVWSPLYVGIAGLALAGVALWQRAREAALWGGAALVALGLSFGGNAALYGLLYNVLPGLRLFRGQERAALVFALALSVLAGLGAAQLVSGDFARADHRQTLKRALAGLLAVVGLVTGAVFVLWLGPTREAYTDVLGPVAFSALLAGLALLTLPWLAERPADPWRQGLLVALVAFDLFTVAQGSGNTEPIPPGERLARPALVEVALADEAVPPQRVDGQRGLLANYGSLWQVPDIRGISPLWLRGPHAIIQEDLPAPRAWELFAVRYVFSDWEELPVPAEVVAEDADPYGPVKLHRLEDPRPFAWLMDDVALVENDEQAYALLADPAFDPRRQIILPASETATLPEALSAEGRAVVMGFAPEAITIELADNPSPAILSIALPHYPGWQAEVDGEAAPLLRAYGALSAVVVPAGAAQVTLTYRPLTFVVGAVVSLVGWGGLGLVGVVLLWRGRRTRPGEVTDVRYE